jgi:hypothetical protein
VLLEMAPPGRLNRFPFVLIRRDWRIDKTALAWDAIRAGKQRTPEGRLESAGDAPPLTAQPETQPAPYHPANSDKPHAQTPRSTK